MTTVVRNVAPPITPDPLLQGGTQALLIVDDDDGIRLSSGVCAGRFAARCPSVFDLISPKSAPDLQRVLDAARAGELPAPLSADLDLRTGAWRRGAVRAFPLPARSGAPVAVTIEYGDLGTADARAPRAALLTSARDFDRLLERALRHYRATGVEYLLGSVEVPRAGDEACPVRLDSLLASLRAGDTVAVTALDRIWVLLCGCGAEQAPGIEHKLTQALSAQCASVQLTTVPVGARLASAARWRAAVRDGQCKDTLSAARRSGGKGAASATPPSRSRRRRGRRI